MGEIVLKAEGVAKTYRPGGSTVPVLRDLFLEIEAGHFTIVLGPSGSGKSTLLNLLGLMDAPDEGEIYFSGQPTRRLDEERRSRLRNERLGFVFQFDSLLPEFTVLENVLMPARIAQAQGRGPGRRESDARARQLLSRLGLAKLFERFPYQCSGGERQRAALCRALMNKPTVLLADEPTGNLDKTNGEMVFKDLQEMAREQGVAVVMVTHNDSARTFADRVFLMQDGTVSQDLQGTRQ